MEIKHDGLFFKYLNMFGEARELDSCKVVKLIFSNLFGCVFLFSLFAFLGFVFVIGLIYPFFLIFGTVGWIAPPLAFSVCVYLGILVIIYKTFKGNLKSTKAGELYDSWKNKYCIKVEVV